MGVINSVYRQNIVNGCIDNSVRKVDTSGKDSTSPDQFDKEPRLYNNPARIPGFAKDTGSDCESKARIFKSRNIECWPG